MKKSIYLGFLLVIVTASITRAQTNDPPTNVDDPGAMSAKQLASRDPVVRQRAAEELARLEATDQRRLVEGFRLQEKNSRVKLALEWALYRMGKSDSLFSLVRALGSSRDDQTTSYLNTLEDPKPLYFFLERMNGNTQIKLLDILAKIGDAETLDRIKPYTQSYDPKIASHAQQAAREIEQRLGQAPIDGTTRPRRAVTEPTAP